jgi:hypothetical protein
MNIERARFDLFNAAVAADFEYDFDRALARVDAACPIPVDETPCPFCGEVFRSTAGWRGAHAAVQHPEADWRLLA